MEAVIFVGGVSLGQPATSIPIATIVGMVCGVICGGLIYAFASRTSQQNLLLITGPVSHRYISSLTVLLLIITNFPFTTLFRLSSAAATEYPSHALAFARPCAI